MLGKTNRCCYSKLIAKINAAKVMRHLASPMYQYTGSFGSVYGF
jgi:hypothetical protein